MTGFASGQIGNGNGTSIHVDIRSLNSRFLDLSFKLPDSYKHLELKVRQAASSYVRRGKCELKLYVNHSALTVTAPAIDMSTLPHWLALQERIKTLSPQAQNLSVAEILALIKNTSQSEAALPNDEVVLNLVQETFVAFNQARAAEGHNLALTMLSHIQELKALREAVLPLIPEIIAQQKQRFMHKFAAALNGAGDLTFSVTAQERALTEATAFAIKIDVTEELDRLNSHLDEIDKLLRHGGPKKGAEIGKRLEFLIQELHREANTLGSKSASLETTQIAVDMKVLIEQLREQIQNIE